ncbi:MAG: DinB family protein [Candidatus Promineifilaceae bacterium]|nr:DinB family protein [Candidatus Promineifilaceae bacterium]
MKELEKSTLVHLFQHNLWANQRLLDTCADVDEAVLEADAVGTYGRIKDTLVHLLAAEERYVTLLTGDPPETPLHEKQGFPGFDALREHAQRSGRALIALAAEDPHDRLLRGEYGSRAYAMPVSLPLLQAINHATEHRAQIMTILTQQGVEPPSLDGWAYGREVGLEGVG